MMPEEKKKENGQGTVHCKCNERAVQEVTDNKKSTRCAAKDLGLSRTTLDRYVANSRKSAIKRYK